MRTVSTRLVFYISGFDPRGVAWYHGLYRRESEKQAAVSGMVISVGSRRRLGKIVSGWPVAGADAGGRVAVEFEFLHWDDIVRANWTRRRKALIADILRSTWASARSGHLAGLLRLSWPFTITALLPFLELLGSFLIAALAAAGVTLALARLAGAPFWPAAVAGLLAGGLLLPFLFSLCEKTNGFWLGRLISATVKAAHGQMPAVEERCRVFAAHIAGRLRQSSCDEVLIVGHSVGSELAIRTVARLLEEAPDERPADGPALSLLTLGQTIPSHAMFAPAVSFRRDLLAVASAPALTWIDFSAPPDPACMALVDPLAACGLAHPPGVEEKPKLLSPRFLRLFEPERYAALRRRKMTMHFMYLLATDKPGDYDYFAITAGSQTLAARYAHLETVRSFDRLKGGRRRRNESVG